MSYCHTDFPLNVVLALGLDTYSTFTADIYQNIITGILKQPKDSLIYDSSFYEIMKALYFTVLDAIDKGMPTRYLLER